MSKMDAMRAMREARYAADRTGAGKPAAKARPTVPTTQPKSPDRAEPSGADAGDDLCGHRAISGRTCTREKGHAAKSHRYS